MSATAEELRQLAWPCLWRLMKRDVTERETRVAAYVVACSLAIGRSETGPLTYREVAAACGMSQGNASVTLRKLARMRVIQATADGGLQFLPESDHERGHRWILLDRLDPSARIVAERMERAHRRRAGEMALPGMEEPDLAAVLGEGAVEAGSRGELAGSREQGAGGSWQGAGSREQGGGNGEGGRGTGGGAKNFVRVVPESGTGVPCRPSIDVFPSQSHMTLYKNSDSIEGGCSRIGNDLARAGSAEPEARKVKAADYLNTASTDEEVLVKRLQRVIGKDGPDGMDKKGWKWRLRIRGTIEAADDPTTAEGMRFALNELERRLVEGKPVKSRGGYLFEQWMDFCNGRGWRMFWNAQGKPQWERCAPFSYFEAKQARKREKRAALAAA